jgi:branched-chain amino acid transport system substrate-binding protein
MSKKILCLLIALLLLGGGQVLAIEGEGPNRDEAQKKKSSEEEKFIYGNTPSDLKPYGGYVREPYKTYWVPDDDPVTFWGPGRDYPEPDVDTVKLGVIAPYERSYETYMGLSIIRGMEMAVEDANAAGGYKGKPFEMVVKNDTGLWGATANEVVDLTYHDKVWAIIGTVDGANTHIAIRVALRTEVPMLNTADLDPTLVETRIPWLIRNVPDDRQKTYTLAYYLYKQLGLRKVAILRANNRYGRFGVAQFRKGSVKLGTAAPIEINYESNFDNVNPDFALQMDRLEKIQPEAVVLWADAEPAGHLIKRMRERGLNMPVYACERVVTQDFLDIAGKAAEGVVAVYPFNPDAGNPGYDDFTRRYKERYGQDPNPYACHTYDGTMMIVEAIRKTGLNRYRIRDVLAGMNNWKGITGEVIMDEALSNRRPISVATVKNGRFVFGIPEMDYLF